LQIIHFIVVLGFILSCASGCMNASDPAKWCVGELNSRLVRVKIEDFVIPQNTPYDGTNLLRQAFLDGYTNGIAEVLRAPELRNMLIHFGWTTEEDCARIQGWFAGRDLVCDKFDEIASNFVGDMICVFSNHQQQALFTSKGQLIYLSDLEIDSTGGIWRTSETTWYDNGQIEEQSHFDREGYIGSHKWWYENGNLRKIETWEKGEINGKCEGYYSNGQRMYSLTCQDSIPVGSAQVWNEDGTSISKGTFQDGVWKETVRAPGYLIRPPSRPVADGTSFDLIYHFSLAIDPSGPVAEQYKQFLRTSEGETNPVIEIKMDVGGLEVLTEDSKTNRTRYCLIKDGNTWKVTHKNTWENWRNTDNSTTSAQRETDK
jgi:hypothetical protein